MARNARFYPPLLPLETLPPMADSLSEAIESGKPAGSIYRRSQIELDQSMWAHDAKTVRCVLVGVALIGLAIALAASVAMKRNAAMDRCHEAYDYAECVRRGF